MSGEAPQQPTMSPEEMQQMLFRAQVGALTLLVPGTTDEAAAAALNVALQQEEQLGQMWQQLAEGPKKYWALRLSRHKKDGKPLIWHAPARMAGSITSVDINAWVLQLGVLTSPFVRAALLISGWDFEFAPSDGPPPQIIT